MQLAAKRRWLRLGRRTVFLNYTSRLSSTVSVARRLTWATMWGYRFGIRRVMRTLVVFDRLLTPIQTAFWFVSTWLRGIRWSMPAKSGWMRSGRRLRRPRVSWLEPSMILSCRVRGKERVKRRGIASQILSSRLRQKSTVSKALWSVVPKSAKD